MVCVAVLFSSIAFRISSTWASEELKSLDEAILQNNRDVCLTIRLT